MVRTCFLVGSLAADETMWTNKTKLQRWLSAIKPGVKGRHWLRDASAVPRRSTYVCCEWVRDREIWIQRCDAIVKQITCRRTPTRFISHWNSSRAVQECNNTALRNNKWGFHIRCYRESHRLTLGCSWVEDLHHYLGNGGGINAWSVT